VTTTLSEKLVAGKSGREARAKRTNSAKGRKTFTRGREDGERRGGMGERGRVGEWKFVERQREEKR
jgi:hypothetical protein